MSALKIKIPPPTTKSRAINKNVGFNKYPGDVVANQSKTAYYYVIEGIRYESAKVAADALGVSVVTVNNRCINPHYSTWEKWDRIANVRVRA